MTLNHWPHNFTLRYWLWRNFGRRGLRWLGERAQRLLFGSLLLPALLPRDPTASAEREGEDGEAASDAHAEREGRAARVVASERVRLDVTYADWIEPLARLPRGTTPEQFRLAAERLPGYAPEGQYFFPASVYLDATRRGALAGAALAHRCRASRGPAIETLYALAGHTSPPPAADEPALLLVYSRP